MAVETEISFHLGAHPEPESRGTLAFVLFDGKTLAPVVMDRELGVLPFRGNPNIVPVDSASSFPDTVVVRIPSEMVRREDETRKPGGIDMEELARVGTVFIEQSKPFSEKLPVVKQRAEIKRLSSLSDEERKRKKIIEFTKSGIAVGMLKGQENINVFMKEMEDSELELIFDDTVAALGTELIIWAVNIPLGSAVLAVTGGDFGAAVISGIAVQGIVRGIYVAPRMLEEMKRIWNKQEEKWKHIVKVGGFGAMYGLILATDFIPGLGSIPLPFLSAPRNTKYVLKNIELMGRMGLNKGRDAAHAIPRKINQLIHPRPATLTE